MYYAVTRQGVIAEKTLSGLRNHPRIHGLIEPEEMSALGADYVVYLDDVDIDFIQDKAKLSKIMFSGFFKKDNTVKIFVFINLFLTFINIVMINNVSAGLSECVNAITALSTALGG